MEGIGDDGWGKIQQFVIEVHDINDRVKEIERILLDKGFQVITDQEGWQLHKLMNIFTIYAKRNAGYED